MRCILIRLPVKWQPENQRRFHLSCCPVFGVHFYLIVPEIDVQCAEHANSEKTNKCRNYEAERDAGSTVIETVLNSV
jgi:hypothetical protein